MDCNVSFRMLDASSCLRQKKSNIKINLHVIELKSSLNNFNDFNFSELTMNEFGTPEQYHSDVDNHLLSWDECLDSKDESLESETGVLAPEMRKGVERRLRKLQVHENVSTFRRFRVVQWMQKTKTTKLVLWDPNTMLLAPLVKQSHRYPLSVASWDNFLQTLKKSTSSGCWATKRGIPAKAFSRSFAVILTPWAPGSSLWLMYWFFTLSSLRGCGVRRALICVTIGPSIPATTTVSPSFSFPLIRITSTVVPRPGRALT